MIVRRVGTGTGELVSGWVSEGVGLSADLSVVALAETEALAKADEWVGVLAS